MMRPDLDRYIAGWRGPLLAALVALLAGLPALLLLPPLDRDESRYAQATSQMLETGDYVDIRFQDDPRWKKPVGIYWMQAAAVAVTSSVENRDIAPYRIPSILGAMLAAAACAWAGAAMFGQRAGFLAGAMLGATFLLSTEAGIAKTDAMLCGAVTLAMAGLARIYLATRAGEAPIRPHKLMFWLGLGLSILIKGPIGLIVVAPAMIALSAWDRDVSWLKRLGWGWGLPLVALIVGPWALAITIATDGGFWREAIMGDLAPKVAGGDEGHGSPPGLYLLIAPLLFFPAALLLPAALSTGWHRRAEPAIRFLICWLVPAWLIFELTPTKLAHYTLPTFGALALLAAAALTRPVGRISRYTGAGLTIAVGALLAVASVWLLTEYGRSTAQTWATITIVFAILAGLIGAFLMLHRAAMTAVIASIALGVIAHAALAGTLRQLRPLSVAPQLEKVLLAANLHPRQGRAGPVAITGFHEPSFVFLTGRATELTDAAGAARALTEGRPVIVEARDADAFREAAAELGVTGRVVGEVNGHNYSKGDDVSLTVYAPPGGPVAEPAP
ncbi:MAG: glycosyltransferase family 39 protein [Alphaproteobacteria bacterium]|nr:glycosyltransferase family 39 protein [Alphaproteobacteria bacterium]MBU2125747.1 glycosyltransferase family 39 protein [Alphaproteobacteria bacterium]MBU2207745.1 glycosyltransferase family 39 protein [Alphaproteobacteria bacterium]MBU2289966.1 glycosyltransferase family 39 protein [Alphaproteobacteria bacterium]MBU2397917.1 glycosyltransferase family 39 protein [Alphaproteobacteria bacterium]